MTHIRNCLWLDGTAEDAARFYTSVLRDGRIDTIAHYTPEMAAASGQSEASVVTVSFEAEGQRFLALNGGSHYSITPGISFIIERDTQDELDEIWAALAHGGEEMACGWVTDRFGVSWQVIPSKLVNEWIETDDHEARRRMWAAMLDMRKLDIATLQAAFHGTTEAAL